MEAIVWDAEAPARIVAYAREHVRSADHTTQTPAVEIPEHRMVVHFVRLPTTAIMTVVFSFIDDGEGRLFRMITFEMSDRSEPRVDFCIALSEAFGFTGLIGGEPLSWFVLEVDPDLPYMRGFGQLAEDRRQ